MVVCPASLLGKFIYKAARRELCAPSAVTGRSVYDLPAPSGTFATCSIAVALWCTYTCRFLRRSNNSRENLGFKAKEDG